ASLCDVLDIPEHLFYRVFGAPKLELAKSGCVDQPGSVRQPQQLAMRCGVASTTVVLTNSLGAQPLLAGQCVGDAALACAGGPKQHSRLTRLEKHSDSVHPSWLRRRRGDDRSARRNTPRLGD